MMPLDAYKYRQPGGDGYMMESFIMLPQMSRA
jgi:hypothetical protein